MKEGIRITRRWLARGTRISTPNHLFIIFLLSTTPPITLPFHPAYPYPTEPPTMLLTELILSKDTALSQVWIAAHYERKLSKQQALRISVQDSVRESPSFLLLHLSFSSYMLTPLSPALAPLNRGHLERKHRTHRSSDVRTTHARCRSYLFEKDAVLV